MSAEIFSIIIAAAGLFITLGGGLLAGFAWMIQRMDKQSASLDQRFDNFREEIRGEFSMFRDEIRGEFSTFRQDLDVIHQELGEIKIGVARLEGPRERLILPAGLSHR